jgi:hypothetical protein
MAATVRMEPPREAGPSASPVAMRSCPACQQRFTGTARFCPYDGDVLVDAAAPELTDPLIGLRVDGRYVVRSVLGEGGMGTVYEVQHATLGRKFALKVLRRDVAGDAEAAKRFVQEAKAAAAIGHPNIVAVSDFGELELPKVGRVPYFVMERLEGGTLAQLLEQKGRLTPERTAQILRQAASALAATHAAGVVHRDLKPDNVFLTGAARDFVKLVDFGVAKMAGAGRLTRAGTVFGTPHYMSPEQAQGEQVDGRSDVYALGVIAYECLAGKLPFEADTYMGVLTKHMFAQPEPLETVVDPGVQLGALAAITMRCLAKDPAARFSSMDDLGRALDGVLASFEAGEPESFALLDSSTRPRGGLRLREPTVAKAPLGRLAAPPAERAVWPYALGAAAVCLAGAGLLLSRGLGEPKPTASAEPSATWVGPRAAAPSGSAPTTATSAVAPAEAPPAKPSEVPSAPAPDRPAADRPAEKGPGTDKTPATRPSTRPSATLVAPTAPPPATAPPGSGGDVVNPW